MKRRWHFLFLLLAFLTAIIAGNLLDQPLWIIEDARYVSFDKCNESRKEWSVLTGDVAGNKWRIETRSGRDPAIIRTLNLALPPSTTIAPYQTTNGFLDYKKYQSSEVICCLAESKDDAALTKSGTAIASILDPNDGKLLRQFKLLRFGIDMLDFHGSRIACLDDDGVILFDAKTKSESKVSLNNIKKIAFSPDGKLLACIADYNEFRFINWDKADTVNARTEPTFATSFSFLTNDVLLIQDFRYSRRWHWDGSNLVPISPGVGFLAPHFLFEPKMEGDGLHVLSGMSKDWHPRLRLFLVKLSKIGLPVEKWFAKDSFYYHWSVFDNQDQKLREYMVSSIRSKRIPLYDQMSLEIDQKEPRSTICLWSEHPIWPNAFAFGMLAYLALYTLMRIVLTTKITP